MNLVLFIQKVSFVSLCQETAPEIFVKQGSKDFFVGIQAYFQVSIQSWKRKDTAVTLRFFVSSLNQELQVKLLGDYASCFTRECFIPSF